MSDSTSGSLDSVLDEGLWAGRADPCLEYMSDLVGMQCHHLHVGRARCNQPASQQVLRGSLKA